jgi:putative proteasome-type protease
VTYCLAVRLDEGLVFLSDTRTNAGVDNVGNYRKLHVLRPGDDRVFVLQSAGSLATTHEVLDRLNADLATPGDHESLATVTHLYEAATYIGRLSREVTQRHWAALGDSATATFILGGQIAGERPDLLLLYPEGNYIRVSDERPFLQIGESKYGKFMLELAVHAKVDLDTAIKIALSSMLSTAHANLSVGPPYDLGVYRNGSLAAEETRLDADSPYLASIREVWMAHFLDAILQLPPLPGD